MIPAPRSPVPVQLVFLCRSGLPGPGGVLRRRLGLLYEQLLLRGLDGLQGAEASLISILARQLGCQAGVLASLRWPGTTTEAALAVRQGLHALMTSAGGAAARCTRRGRPCPVMPSFRPSALHTMVFTLSPLGPTQAPMGRVHIRVSRTRGQPGLIARPSRAMDLTLHRPVIDLRHLKPNRHGQPGVGAGDEHCQVARRTSTT